MCGDSQPSSRINHRASAKLTAVIWVLGYRTYKHYFCSFLFQSIHLDVRRRFKLFVSLFTINFDLVVSNFKYLFWFFHLRLPEETVTNIQKLKLDYVVQNQDISIKLILVCFVLIFKITHIHIWLYSLLMPKIYKIWKSDFVWQMRKFYNHQHLYMSASSLHSFLPLSSIVTVKTFVNSNHSWILWEMVIEFEAISRLGG